MLGRGTTSIVLDNGDDTVMKIMLLRNEKDKYKFTNEVFALLKFSEYDVCPKIYSSRIADDTDFKKYFYTYKDENKVGIIIMEKMDGTLLNYKEKYEKDRNIKIQLKEKYKIMLKHGFIYSDMHEENILYKKKEDTINWYFGDMDIYTFEEYKQIMKELNKSPEEYLNRCIKRGFIFIESL